MIKSSHTLPQTVEQAVERLISELPSEKKAWIANTGEWNLMDLFFSLSVDVEDLFCLQENTALVESCRAVSGDDHIYVEEASFTIITELWKRLKRVSNK